MVHLSTGHRVTHPSSRPNHLTAATWQEVEPATSRSLSLTPTDQATKTSVEIDVAPAEYRIRLIVISEKWSHAFDAQPRMRTGFSKLIVSKLLKFMPCSRYSGQIVTCVPFSVIRQRPPLHSVTLAVSRVNRSIDNQPIVVWSGQSSRPNIPFTRGSKHETNLEHTSCTCILSTFASCWLFRVNGV